MTSIQERVYVSCPFGKAPSYLNYYLDELAKSSGTDGAVLRLSVPLAEFGIPSNLSVFRDVVAAFEPPDEKVYGLARTPVRWKPEGGGPFPDFSGVITVEQDERYGSCALVLEGSYKPPLGTVGEVFDAAMGRRIAKRTARELLRMLRKRLEADWSSAQYRGADGSAQTQKPFRGGKTDVAL